MLAPSLDPPLPRKVGISDNYFFPMISFVKFILVTHTFGGEHYNTITTYELCKRIQISGCNKNDYFCEYYQRQIEIQIIGSDSDLDTSDH